MLGDGGEGEGDELEEIIEKIKNIKQVPKIQPAVQSVSIKNTTTKKKLTVPSKSTISDHTNFTTGLPEDVGGREIPFGKRKFPTKIEKNPSSSRSPISNEGMRGAAIHCLLCVGNNVWGGCVDGRINFWHIPSRTFVGSKAAHNSRIFALIEVEDLIWSAADDTKVKVWTKNGTPKKHLSLDFSITSMIYAGDQVWCGTYNDGYILVLDPKTVTPTLLLDVQHPIRYLFFDKVTDYVWACSESTIIRIHHKTHHVVDHVQGSRINSIVGVDVSDTIWTGSSDGSISVFQRQSGELRLKTTKAHDDKIFVLMGSGHFVWSGGCDRKIRVWDAQKFTAITTLACDDIVNAIIVVPMNFWIDPSEPQFQNSPQFQATSPMNRSQSSSKSTESPPVVATLAQKGSSLDVSSPRTPKPTPSTSRTESDFGVVLENPQISTDTIALKLSLLDKELNNKAPSPRLPKFLSQERIAVFPSIAKKKVIHDNMTESVAVDVEVDKEQVHVVVPLLDLHSQHPNTPPEGPQEGIEEIQNQPTGTAPEEEQMLSRSGGSRNYWSELEAIYKKKIYGDKILVQIFTVWSGHWDESICIWI